MANIPRLRTILKARRNAECLDTVLSRSILAICHKPTRCRIAMIYCINISVFLYTARTYSTLVVGMVMLTSRDSVSSWLDSASPTGQ